MKGSLEILEVLMCLDAKNYTLSSTIRERLGNQNLNTLNSRLDRLSRQNILEKKNRKQDGDKIKPGGDKIKYKLTKPIGTTLKDELLKRATNVLLLDQEKKKELLKTILINGSEISEIEEEYSKTLEAYSSGKEFTTLKKKLTSVLKKHLL